MIEKDYSVEFEIHEANTRPPTWSEIFRGKFYPGDTVKTINVSSADIKRMAILSLFGFRPPQHLDRACVIQKMIEATEDLIDPKDGVHTPYVEIFLRTIDGRRKQQLATHIRQRCGPNPHEKNRPTKERE